MSNLARLSCCAARQDIQTFIFLCCFHCTPLYEGRVFNSLPLYRTSFPPTTGDNLTAKSNLARLRVLYEKSSETDRDILLMCAPPPAMCIQVFALLRHKRTEVTSGTSFRRSPRNNDIKHWDVRSDNTSSHKPQRTADELGSLPRWFWFLPVVLSKNPRLSDYTESVQHSSTQLTSCAMPENFPSPTRLNIFTRKQGT